MNCIAVQLLTEIRDALNVMNEHLRNLDTLDERRRKNREHMASVRSANKSVCTQDSVCTHKEEEKGEKESPPHTPSIGKEGKEEEISLSRACAREADIDAKFDAFWNAYPSFGGRKRDKDKCRKTFGKLFDPKTDPAPLFKSIMNGLANWGKTRDWTEGFVCAPLVWLNNRRWEVEIAADYVRPSNPRESAFERDRAEAERIHRESVALACRILDGKGPSYD